VKSPGDHEVDDDPGIAVEAECDSLAKAADFSDGLAFNEIERRIERANQEGVTHPNPIQLLADNVALQRLRVDRDIGEFGHWIRGRGPVGTICQSCYRSSGESSAMVSSLKERIGAANGTEDLRQTWVQINAGKGVTAYLGLHPRKGGLLVNIRTEKPIPSPRVRKAELAMFTKADGKKPKTADDVSMTAVVPAFVLSELKTAFIIGFVVFIPFLVIDIVVSSSLMSMGMMMLPPVFVSLPFKLLLFVMVDGWGLVVRSLLKSFA